MSKIRFVRCDYLSLKRYYTPVVIELDLLRRMIPELPENEAEAEQFLRKDSSLMVDFLKWYYPDDSGTVTDPKGKGRDWPEKIGIEEVKIQTENDSGWRWLFSNFSEAGEDTIKEFCVENNIQLRSPEDKQRALMEHFQTLLAELKKAEVSSFDARTIFSQAFPQQEESLSPAELYAGLANTNLEEVQKALDYLEKELTSPLSLERFFLFDCDDLDGAGENDILQTLAETIYDRLIENIEETDIPHLKYIALWMLGQMAALDYEIPPYKEPFLVSELSKLTLNAKISVFDRELTQLPSTLRNLNKLVELNISGTDIKELPPSLQNHSFQKLMIRGSTLQTLPKDVHWLELDAEQLEKFKDILPTIPNLQVLDLKNQGLTTLPEELAQCLNLKELHLSDNQLTEIPDSIQNLPNLIRLYTQNNPLKPSKIQKILQLTDSDWDKTFEKAESILDNIEILDLKGGNFGSLNIIFRQFLRCPSLKTIDLRDNPWIKLPDDFFRIFKGLSVDEEGNIIYPITIKVDEELKEKLDKHIYLALKNTDSAFRTQLKILSLQGLQLKILTEFDKSFPNLEKIDVRGLPLSKTQRKKFRGYRQRGVEVLGKIDK